MTKPQDIGFPLLLTLPLGWYNAGRRRKATLHHWAEECRGRGFNWIVLVRNSASDTKTADQNPKTTNKLKKINPRIRKTIHFISDS